MDGDDEFGDLYADIGPEVGRSQNFEHLETEADADLGDEDDEALKLYGTSSSSLRTLTSDVPSLPSSSSQRKGIQPVQSSKEADNDEAMLYGFLYGQLNGGPVETPPVAESFPKRASSAATKAQRENSLEDARARASGEPKHYDRQAERTDPDGPVYGLSSEIADRGDSGATTLATKNAEIVPSNFQQHFDGRGTLPSKNDDSSSLDAREWQLLQSNLAPGLTSNAPALEGRVAREDEDGGQSMGEGDEEGGEGASAEQEDFEGGEEEWDSESEDDLNIVLNDDPPRMYGGERAADDVEGSDDEEDLVIVTGGEDGIPIEEQAWDEQANPTDAAPGAVGATLSLADRQPSGEDRGQGGKGSGGQGAGPGAPRFGYSGQGYHANHMQYKYVRPGAGGLSGTAAVPGQASPQGGVPSGRGAPGGWGQGRGAGGTGEWLGGGGRGSGQRLQASGGIGSWGASRGHQGGMEFNLPPTKTVFDVDIESLEEKPWRKQGVDITDYFNFSFTETSWKQYCRQLAQLRLEATMQSKIRVYESGRSEQDYDPDLPPELAVAAGLQDAMGDPNLQQQRLQDAGIGTSGRGRGLGRGRAILQPGRAIQVEGGGGERRPSADVRRQRSRDSDAIVLVDATEEEPPAPTPGRDGSEEFQEEDAERGPAAPAEKERRFFRPGHPGPWEMEGHPGMWDRKNGPNGPMGMGPVPNMMGLPGGAMMPPAHRMDVEGPGGPFPAGPGMPMHQPGPNFGMFPGGPFGPPPVVRPGMVRPPFPPRPGPPLQGPVRPPPDEFGPMMMPLDYHEPSRHRTPPQLSPPRRTPPHAFPADWDEELSNGSVGNWNSRDGYNNHREVRDYDGASGDWRADDSEMHGGTSHPSRRSRDRDRSYPRDRSVEDRASPEARSDNNIRSTSRDRHLEENDWDLNQIPRIPKKQRIQQDMTDSRTKPERDEYNNRSKGSRDDAARSEELRSRSRDPGQEDDLLVEDRVQQQRRPDGSYSKTSYRKGPSVDEDSIGTQQRDSGWHDEQDGETKDRRQLRDREESNRWSAKEDDPSLQRHGGSRDYDVDWERHRDHQERERTHLRKDKEDERVSAREERSSRRHAEDHNWTSRDQARAAWEEGQSGSAERESDHLKERRKREEERSRVRARVEEYREIDTGRLKGRLDDEREIEGKGRVLDDRRESDSRLLQLRSEDGRESAERRSKGRLQDVGSSGEKRERVWLENSRDSESRYKGRVDGINSKSQLEEALVESDGRGRGRREDVRDGEGGLRTRREDTREGDVRARLRRDDVRVEMEERARTRTEDPRESNGRGGKVRLEDVRDVGDARIRGRQEDARESERAKGRSEGTRESERRMRRRSEDIRESDGRVKGRLEDVRDSDLKLKGWPEDVRESEGKARQRERVDEPKERDSRLRSRLDDQRQSEPKAKGRLDDHIEVVDARGKLRIDEAALDSQSRGRRYERVDAMPALEGRRRHEEKNSSRSESNPGKWSRSAEVWKEDTNDQRISHKDKRKWDGPLSGATEAFMDRNGALVTNADERGHGSHTEGGSKKRRVDENYTRAKFEKASSIDDTIGLAAASTRHKEKKAAGQKRSKEHFGRRPHGKDVTTYDLQDPTDEKVFVAENGSSEDEAAAEHRGRSKFERWNSRRNSAAQIGDLESLHEKPVSASQRASSERRSRATDQHRVKDERKETQGVTGHSRRRHSDAEAKEGYDTGHGSGSRGDTVFPSAAATPKDAIERRKERIERNRLLQAETTARRQKDDASLLQAGYVEEVKQERPARKRRWGGTG